METIDIPSKLPADIEKSHRLYVQAAQRYNDLLDIFKKQESELAFLKRHVFGQRSERLFVDAGQTVLPGFGKEVPSGESEQSTQEVKGHKRRPPKKGHGRGELPDTLARERVVHEPSSDQLTCVGCGGEKSRIGEEVTEELEYNPASLFVREHARPKYACKCCGDGVVIAPLPSRPIEKGRPGPGLLAQVCIAKYVDHLPLHRQMGIFRRSGVHIPKSTMVDWIRGVYDLLFPLIGVMREDILTSFCVKSDDTPIRVLTKEKKGRSHKGFMWTYLGVGHRDKTPDRETGPPKPRQVVFEYTRTRSKDGPLTFLDGYWGFLQADAYAGYDACFATRRMIEAGCWAHARRKFFDAQATDKTLALEMLEKIGALFHVERMAKEEGLDVQGTFKKRQKESRPIVASIKSWLDTQGPRVLPKSPIGEAITYALNQWRALTRFLDDGRLDLDNNASERAIRTVAIGRKNWNFAGSHEGAKRMALIYSLAGSCRLLNIDPFEYMRDVIDRLPDYPIKKIRDLTPLGWKEIKEKKEV